MNIKFDFTKFSVYAKKKKYKEFDFTNFFLPWNQSTVWKSTTERDHAKNNPEINSLVVSSNTNFCSKYVDFTEKMLIFFVIIVIAFYSTFPHSAMLSLIS